MVGVVRKVQAESLLSHISILFYYGTLPSTECAVIRDYKGDRLGKWGILPCRACVLASSSYFSYGDASQTLAGSHLGHRRPTKPSDPPG